MSGTSQQPVAPAQLKRVVWAASIGNSVEWFDFALYGFLATTIAQVFFPSGDNTTALLKTFAVFAVAFAFRPLGGLVFVIGIALFALAGGLSLPETAGRPLSHASDVPANPLA